MLMKETWFPHRFYPFSLCVNDSGEWKIICDLWAPYVDFTIFAVDLRNGARVSQTLSFKYRSLIYLFNILGTLMELSHTHTLSLSLSMFVSFSYFSGLHFSYSWNVIWWIVFSCSFLLGCISIDSIYKSDNIGVKILNQYN